MPIAVESLTCARHADQPLQCRLPIVTLYTRAGYSGDACPLPEVWARQQEPITGYHVAVRVPAASSDTVLATGSTRGSLEVK